MLQSLRLLGEVSVVKVSRIASTPSTPEALRCVHHGAQEICTRKCGRENFSARSRREYEAVLCSGCSRQQSSGARKRALLVTLFTARHVSLLQIRQRRESRRLCSGLFCRNDTCFCICVAAICRHVWCLSGVNVRFMLCVLTRNAGQMGPYLGTAHKWMEHRHRGLCFGRTCEESKWARRSDKRLVHCPVSRSLCVSMMSEA